MAYIGVSTAPLGGSRKGDEKMCGKLVNLPQRHREKGIRMPNDGHTLPWKLEERFGDVAHHERGQLTRDVLQIIPPTERKALTDWVKREMRKDDVAQDLIELLVFYAIAFVTAVGKSVHDTVAMIREKRSISGLILKPA